MNRPLTAADPPEPIIDRHCPLHGDGMDPDDARDLREERRRTGRGFW